MKLFTFLSRPLHTAAPNPERSGLTLIDPKDYKHVGGGSPRGTWAATSSTSTSAKTVSSPRGTW